MTTRAARDASRRASAADDDITVYPVEERGGEEILHRWIVELLRPLVERWLAERRELALTGADQFSYWRRGDTRKRVAPDVFVLPGVRPDRRIRSWKIWQDGVVPSFALEVVSQDVDKDYIEGPVLYGELGVRELIVFDPDWEQDQARYRFQVYRRVGKRGLVRAEVTNEDRVRSRVLGCWVRAVGGGEQLRLRLATGATGDALFATEAERERGEKERALADKERALADRERALAEKERERGEKERERGEKERALAEKDAAVAARRAAEDELARLRASLARRPPRKR